MGFLGKKRFGFSVLDYIVTCNHIIVWLESGPNVKARKTLDFETKVLSLRRLSLVRPSPRSIGCGGSGPAASLVGSFAKYDGAPTTSIRMSGPIRTAIMSFATWSPDLTPALSTQSVKARPARVFHSGE